MAAGQIAGSAIKRSYGLDGAISGDLGSKLRPFRRLSENHGEGAAKKEEKEGSQKAKFQIAIQFVK